MEEEKRAMTVCINCMIGIPGTREADGSVKAKCPSCGTTVISRRLSRRHMRLEIFAPNKPKKV